MVLTRACLLGIDGGSVTGMAYIQGSEGVSDLGGLLARYLGEGAPQPDRLRFADLWTDQPLLSLGISLGSFSSIGLDTATVPLRQQWYHSHLRPLLVDMNVTFAKLSQRFLDLPSPPKAARETLQDLSVSAKLLSLRCAQVLALYDHAASCGPELNSPPTARAGWCKEKLSAARSALNEALALVPEREANYGLTDHSIQRVAGWRAEAPNPTAYNFGYLWAARNLFYWQRDQAIVEQRICNPCFGNINDVVQLGLQNGGGKLVHGLRDAIHGLFSNRLWSLPLAECMAVAQEEPDPLGIIPRPGKRGAGPSAAVQRHPDGDLTSEIQV